MNEEIPAVTQAKKDLEQLVKRRQHTVSALERENKKLERMQNSINSKDPEREDVLDQQLLDQQIEKIATRKVVCGKFAKCPLVSSGTFH